MEEKEASPCKKQKAEPEGVLTLDMIREAMRAELSKNRDELGQAVATVREEVVLFGKRVDNIEAGVTANHEKQTEAVQEMKEEQKTQAGHLQALRDSQAELELLEGKFRGTSTAAGSTVDTNAPKRPALIIGGWPEDQAASETLDKAKAILRQLDVPIDYSEMFVPGLKRGYAITEHAAEGSPSQCHDDGGGATPQGVDVPLPISGEATQSPPGGAVLEMGGMAHALEVEFSTGSVWYRNERISSGTLDMPKGGEKAGALARLLGKSGQRRGSAAPRHG